MRHMHAGDDSRGRFSLEQERSTFDGRHSRRAVRESLPLYRLHTNFRGCRGSCAARQRVNMRSDPAEYEMVAPGSLSAALELLAHESQTWLPIAGGTDVMVQYAAGKLPARKLMSIWNLPELRQIEVSQNEIWIGAGCTYTDLRRHEIVSSELPLLASVASLDWRNCEPW